MLGGDTIVPTLVGSSRDPGGDQDDRAASIEKFKDLTFPDDMVIHNGHFPEATWAEVMETNADLR